MCLLLRWDFIFAPTLLEQCIQPPKRKTVEAEIYVVLQTYVIGSVNLEILKASCNCHLTGLDIEGVLRCMMRCFGSWCFHFDGVLLTTSKTNVFVCFVLFFPPVPMLIINDKGGAVVDANVPCVVYVSSSAGTLLQVNTQHLLLQCRSFLPWSVRFRWPSPSVDRLLGQLVFVFGVWFLLLA